MNFVSEVVLNVSLFLLHIEHSNKYVFHLRKNSEEDTYEATYYYICLF